MDITCEHLSNKRCLLYGEEWSLDCPGIRECDCFKKGDCKYYKSENDIIGFCSIYELRTMCQGRSPECGY